jgi:hypothetical protein
MTIVTNVPKGIRCDMMIGGRWRHGTLTISGLVEGSNVIPHGLAFAPSKLSFRPGPNDRWGETQAPDATNIYITVGTGGATVGAIDYEE